ncbi:MAG TPA: hypothetical protein VGO48_13105 [Conexibacter sp.]|jgi:hypothetical protein|nr:hypothetical protein [Conexibacter sp.]
MAVVNTRLLIGLAVGAGIGAALARRRAHEPVEPCCEKPAAGASCC